MLIYNTLHDDEKPNYLGLIKLWEKAHLEILSVIIFVMVLRSTLIREIP